MVHQPLFREDREGDSLSALVSPWRPERHQINLPSIVGSGVISLYDLPIYDRPFRLTGCTGCSFFLSIYLLALRLLCLFVLSIVFPVWTLFFPMRETEALNMVGGRGSGRKKLRNKKKS